MRSEANKGESLSSRREKVAKSFPLNQTFMWTIMRGSVGLSDVVKWIEISMG